MQSTYKKALARKQGEILACQYGHKWPLNLHTDGYCLILNSLDLRYVWSKERETLYDIATSFGDLDGMGNSI